MKDIGQRMYTKETTMTNICGAIARRAFMSTSADMGSDMTTGDRRITTIVWKEDFRELSLAECSS